MNPYKSGVTIDPIQAVATSKNAFGWIKGGLLWGVTVIVFGAICICYCEIMVSLFDQYVIPKLMRGGKASLGILDSYMLCIQSRKHYMVLISLGIALANLFVIQLLTRTWRRTLWLVTSVFVFIMVTILYSTYVAWNWSS